MSDDTHTQEKDHKEIEKLAKEGKLLTFTEFIPYVFKACDIHNNKPHRGVLDEWKWHPKPTNASPKECLMACWNEGWRPNVISEELADLTFLASKEAVVRKGMITLNKEYYTHDSLIELHEKRITIRFDPMAMDEVHCFNGKKYICTARTIERSNMLDQDMISRKNAEKRALCKKVIDEYKRLTAIIPDFRKYTDVPAIERTAALIGADRKRRAIENSELFKSVTPEEFDLRLLEMEELNKPKKAVFSVPERPAFWSYESERHNWCLRAFVAGVIPDADRQWMLQYESKLSPAYKERIQHDLGYLTEEYNNSLDHDE